MALVRGSARRCSPGISPATAMYRKPAAATARAYGSAPMVLREPKKAASAPTTEASPVARFSSTRALPRQSRRAPGCAKSPTRCGISCAATAKVVTMPSGTLLRKAAAISTPSRALCTLSPIRTSTPEA